MGKITFLACFLIFSVLNTAQEKKWDPALDCIDRKSDKIERILFFTQEDNYPEEIDSLKVKNSSEFGNIVMTLYDTTIDVDQETEYVAGMDISFLELIDVKQQEQKLKLFLTWNCDKNSNKENPYLLLNISSDKDVEEMYVAFKKLLTLRNSYHDKLHELNQCTLEDT